VTGVRRCQGRSRRKIEREISEIERKYDKIQRVLRQAAQEGRRRRVVQILDSRCSDAPLPVRACVRPDLRFSSSSTVTTTRGFLVFSAESKACK
jgi:hypothetical protein